MRFLHEMQELAQRQLDGMAVNRDVMANDVKVLVSTINEILCIAKNSTIDEHEAIGKLLRVCNRINGVR